MMKNANNLDRRRFLQAALGAGLVWGGGVFPRMASAAPAPLTHRILVNLMLDGGPDFRHLIVPAFDTAGGSFGNLYWTYRRRAHRLGAGNNPLRRRWEDDYYPITVGGDGWNSGLVDAGNLNTGVTFGIWREAGWLIDMFRAGNAALVFNAVGGTNRAHDLSTLMLNQGNLTSGLNDADRSGWGGRLARSAGRRSISLLSSPSAFNFGPVGDAPGYNPNAIDNRDLVSVDDAREMGLFDPAPDGSPHGDFNDKMARAAKSYYAGLRQEQIHQAYEKFMDHEAKVRAFGEQLQERLDDDTLPMPILLEALRNDVDGINPDPANNGSTGRRVLRSRGFASQVRNLHDVIVANDLLNPGVLAMRYGGWDSHADQRQTPTVLNQDPDNPFESRGIESGFRDIFGGQCGVQYGISPSNPDALHCGFSALWASLPPEDLQNIVITIAGEFGRQIRDNGGAGTDHGRGNLMLVISDGCQGGIYGEMFPDDEIAKYESSSRSPDISPRTEIDPLFAAVCDWVSPFSGAAVFPRTVGQGGTPMIELPGMFDGMLYDI